MESPCGSSIICVVDVLHPQKELVTLAIGETYSVNRSRQSTRPHCTLEFEGDHTWPVVVDSYKLTSHAGDVGCKTQQRFSFDAKGVTEATEPCVDIEDFQDCVQVELNQYCS